MTSVKSAKSVASINPVEVKIDDIRANHVDKPIIIHCKVDSVTNVHPRLTVGAFECLRCGSFMFIPQDKIDNRFLEPEYCSCDEYNKKQYIRFRQDESKFEDYQEAMVYDENKKRKLKLAIRGDNLGVLNPRDTITVVGTLRSVFKHKREKGVDKMIFVEYRLEVSSINKDDASE